MATAAPLFSESKIKEILDLLNVARTNYDIAIQINPDDGLYYYQRSSLLSETSLFDQLNRKNLVEGALNDLESAIQLHPEFKDNAKSEDEFRSPTV